MSLIVLQGQPTQPPTSTSPEYLVRVRDYNKGNPFLSLVNPNFRTRGGAFSDNQNCILQLLSLDKQIENPMQAKETSINKLVLDQYESIPSEWLLVSASLSLIRRPI